MVKHFPELNPLKEMVHKSPFMSSEPIFLEMAGNAIFEEYDSNEILHFCEDERSSSLLSKFEPLPSGPEKVVLDHDRDSTMISHDESLEMENPWAMEFCEAPTLESDEKDSTDEHRIVIFEIPCSFNATPESGMLSAPCTHEDYNNLMVLFCKTFRRLVVDVYVYRKHCRFRGCTVALIL
jgi:hypothetical protein